MILLRSAAAATVEEEVPTERFRRWIGGGMKQMHRVPRTLWLVSAITALLPVSLEGQVAPTVRLIREGCPACRIELDTLVRITDPTGEGGLARGPLGRDAGGRWLVASGATPGLIAIYDSVGRFVRLAGGRGDGPGEYRVIGGLVPSRDGSLRVLEAFSRRITRLDPDFKVQSTDLMAEFVLVDLAHIGEGDEVVLASSSNPRSMGYPLHRLREGKVVFSFGATDPDYRRDKAWLSRRNLSYSPSSGLWTSEIHRYRLERWDPESGELLDRVDRVAPWLPAMEPPFRLDVEGGDPPKGGLVGIHIDQDELAWVMLRVPDQSWRRGIGEGSDPYGRPSVVLTDANLVWDTVVEVVDLQAGIALARMRFDRVVTGFAWGVDGTAMAVLYEESSLGFPSVTVVGLRLSRGPTQFP